MALKLRSFITEICSAVLSEALGETEEGTHNVGIWPRTLDGARTDIRMKTELYSGRQAISKRPFTGSRTTQCLRKLIRQRAEACRHIFKIVLGVCSFPTTLHAKGKCEAGQARLCTDGDI